MKSCFALLIFVQLAASWVAASPVEAREFVIFVKYPGEETSDKVQRSPATQPKHPFFVHYPASEDANNAQRSPLGDVPLIHYPGGNTENDKNLPKARASLSKSCVRDTAHTGCKPFVHYPEEE
ncbi:hypothetical protein DFH08DRAFT_979362 [Mycena albidolilacea]|uniref:Uncharacterized protein n=1 Tax=Mycena albidolilacea TaxID=1033008 RepID=A0AAD6YXB2_9AGAR|nr:hypothetical protein DFH08DRAFT_979362 [Mycena albidolilacea]